MEVIKSDKIKPIGPYSIAVKSDNLVFVSGQIGTGSDVKEQTKSALEKLKEILELGGSSLDKVVKTTVFLKNMADFDHMNEIYKEFFQGNFPARSTVQVAALPKNALIEIEAVAET